MKFKLFWITMSGCDLRVWLEESFECNDLGEARIITADYYTRTKENAKSLAKGLRPEGEDIDLYLDAETDPWYLCLKIVAGIGKS